MNWVLGATASGLVQAWISYLYLSFNSYNWIYLLYGPVTPQRGELDCREGLSVVWKVDLSVDGSGSLGFRFWCQLLTCASSSLRVAVGSFENIWQLSVRAGSHRRAKQHGAGHIEPTWEFSYPLHFLPSMLCCFLFLFLKSSFCLRS